MLRALLCRDGVQRMRKDAELAVDTLTEGSQLAAAARLLAGFAHFLGGDDGRAAAYFVATVDVAEELGANVCASMALAGLSLLATTRSELREAEDYARRALEILREAHLEEYAASAFVYAVGARAAMARGGGGAARMNRERADRLVSKSTYALPWLAVLTRLELARLHLASQNPGRAGELLQEIEHIYTRRPNLGIADGRVEQLRHDLDVGRSPDVGWASTMTAAELRLLPLLATHLSFREIAERLHISRNTVKTQAIAVYRKLGVSSRSAAVERARELGLLRNPSQRGERPQTTEGDDAHRNGADGAGDAGH